MIIQFNLFEKSCSTNWFLFKELPIYTVFLAEKKELSLWQIKKISRNIFDRKLEYEIEHIEDSWSENNQGGTSSIELEWFDSEYIDILCKTKNLRYAYKIYNKHLEKLRRESRFDL